MTDHESRLRAALEAGPSAGLWTPCETATEKHMAWVTDGASTIALVGALDPESANANARLIAAANPEAIRSLLDRNDRLEAENVALRNEVKALRATTSRGDSAKRLSDAPAGLGVERCGAGWQCVPVKPTNAMCEAFENAHHRADFRDESYAAMLAAAPLPDAPVTQEPSHGSEQDGETQ